MTVESPPGYGLESPLDFQWWRIAPRPNTLDVYGGNQWRSTPFGSAIIDEIVDTSFVQTGTSGSSLAWADNSTIKPPLAEILESTVGDLFECADVDDFSYGYNNRFSEALESFVRTFDNPSIEAIQQHITFTETDEIAIVEALHVLGCIQHQPTHQERLLLLLHMLFASSARIRCGAALGLAHLDDPKATPYVKNALKDERFASAKTCIQRVLEQLEDTQRQINAHAS